MAELMNDREVHELIEDALATIRFYRAYSASAELFPERFREVIEILRATAKNRNSKLLADVAEGIERGYGSGPMPGGQ